VALIIDDLLRAARIEHLVAVGGESAREYLLGESCRITPNQIAGLCRRMPPFIQAKLKEVEAGLTNVDSNPTGAFDTNGWAELRVRLARFRGVIQGYARQCDDNVPIDLPPDLVTKIQTLASSIRDECLHLLSRFHPEGIGSPPKSTTHRSLQLDWAAAPVRLAQVLGVLRKTNRDLRLVHWRWQPTTEDLKISTGNVIAMLGAPRP
jgi:hypothetical protein